MTQIIKKENDRYKVSLPVEYMVNGYVDYWFESLDELREKIHDEDFVLCMDLPTEEHFVEDTFEVNVDQVEYAITQIEEKDKIQRMQGLNEKILLTLKEYFEETYDVFVFIEDHELASGEFTFYIGICKTNLTEAIFRIYHDLTYHIEDNTGKDALPEKTFESIKKDINRLKIVK